VIPVRKGPPPPALTTYRLTRDARYDGAGFNSVKPSRREALVAEQRGVCCYCTDRTEATEAGMKVEHHTPQHGPHGGRDRDLDWSNLLGACRGEAPPPRGRGAKMLHCDSAKGEDSVSINPTNPSHMAAIEYERGGRVTSSRPEHQAEIDHTLRLNIEPLLDRRKDALVDLEKELRQRYDVRAFPAAKFEKLLAQTRDPAGQTMRPFAGFLCWWLERALRKAV